VAKYGVLAVVAMSFACSGGGQATQPDPDGGTGGGGTIKDGGTGSDAGTPGDAGTDAGTPLDGGTDGGLSGGIVFGTPGPWPMGNVTYDGAQGIQEAPVIGVTTDEAQNMWVATNAALYLMRPTDAKFTRFDASAGLHLPGNPVNLRPGSSKDIGCPDSAGQLIPCPAGYADSPGIREIVGGGPNEVFVGYYGHHDYTLGSLPDGTPIDGTENDPWRHSGQLDRVHLQADGTLQVVRMQMVSNNTVEFWHNRNVERMIFDHFIHPHELYVGTDHGVDKISPDKWHDPVGWFLLPTNQQEWMSDHLHPQACLHAACTANDTVTQMLGDWRGLAIDHAGDLWVGGRWAAGAITWVADNTLWYNNGAPPTGRTAFKAAFGDPYLGGCAGNRPVFCPPQEGDVVNISATTVTPDGKVWFSSGSLYNDPKDVPYGIASWDGSQFVYYDPVRDVGMQESNVQDMVALPDGRIVVAGLNSGLVFWNPATGQHTAIHAGGGIPSDQVWRLELDAMVNPPALHVATLGGAAVLRVLP
jgi:hypothetical protein